MLCFTRESICSSFARVSFSPRPPTPRAIMRTNLLWNFIQKMFQKQTVPKITLLVVNWLIGKENPVLRYAIQVCFRLFYLERPRDVVSYPSFVSLQLVNLKQYTVAMSLNYFSNEINCLNVQFFLLKFWLITDIIRLHVYNIYFLIIAVFLFEVNFLILSMI